MVTRLYIINLPLFRSSISFLNRQDISLRSGLVDASRQHSRNTLLDGCKDVAWRSCGSRCRCNIRRVEVKASPHWWQASSSLDASWRLQCVRDLSSGHHSISNPITSSLSRLDSSRISRFYLLSSCLFHASSRWTTGPRTPSLSRA